MSEFNELDFLHWFFTSCDFGPAHEDVIIMMIDEYEAETGQIVPSEYDYRKEED